MPELTSEQIFIVRRLTTKIGAAKHHLRDAASAAKYTSPEVLAQAGIADAVEMLRGCLRDLEVALRPVVLADPLNVVPAGAEAPTDG
jgi:C4-dicarboxylate-specific signal transduction histidine kinase